MPGSRAIYPSLRDGDCCSTSTYPSPGICLFASGLWLNSRFKRRATNSRRIELRPILDREFTRWQVVFNPVFERAMHGPGTRHGWNFEPALLLRWKRRTFSPSIEYYGEIESIYVPPSAQPEVHQLFAEGDWGLKAGIQGEFGRRV